MCVCACLHLCACACLCAHWCVPTEKKNACVYVFFIQHVYVRACGGASVKGIVSWWQRGSRKNDSYVCGLITINSPFDCN